LVLSGICVLLLAGIWWWSVRSSRQARGAPELREPRAGAPAASPPPAAPLLRDAVEPREWSISPLEPLSIKTADFDRVPILDLPMMADVQALEDSGEFEEISIDREADPESRAGVRAEEPNSERSFGARAPLPPAAVGAPQRADSPPPAAAPPAQRSANTSELQKIVSVRVCAVGDARWPGARLMAALDAQGLAYGRYQVYHRNHADGRSLFCVASLVEPGTFDAAHMAEQEFRGVSLFAVLPGPEQPLQTVDELIAAAKGLAEALTGSVQDAKGVPMSPQRAAALRDEVARFQALLV
jgi:cell division protein ZipA